MLTLASYFHTLDPFIVEFGQGVGLRWYGTAYAAGFLVAWAILRWLSQRGVTPLTTAQVGDAMMIWCLGVVAGGRLGYVLFYDPALLVSFSARLPFWSVLAVNQGGMSSHGGMLGVLVASWWIFRRVNSASAMPTLPTAERVPMLHVMDLAALACTPGLGFGRLANFVNGELLGDIAAAPGSAAPWYTVKFPQERFSAHEPVLSPAQQATFDALLDKYRMGSAGDDVTYDRILGIVHSQADVPGSQARDIIQTLEPLICARYPSQLLQAGTEGLMLGLVLFFLWRTPRRAGVIVATFLLFYGVTRMFTELVRLPDAHLTTQRFAGLTRGQLLSVVMIAGGLACVYAARRSNWVRRGWGTSTS